MRRSAIAALMLMAAALSACGTDKTDPSPHTPGGGGGGTGGGGTTETAKSAFSKKSQYGVYGENSSPFTFDETTWQTAHGSKGTSRIQKDDMSIVVAYSLSAEPKSGNSIPVSVSCDGTSFKHSQTMTVLRKTEDRVWLWDEANAIGHIIPWE